jgi:hypothetical protein
MSAGCAAMPQDRGTVRHDACPPGRTLICTERLGQLEKCSCELEEGFEEIFDPRK